MKSIRLVVVLLALYALTLPASAATLVVLNKSEHTASLIDPDSGKTLAKLPVGRGPHEVIVSPDGRTAYVSNFGPYGICPTGDTMCKTPGNTIQCSISRSARSKRHTTSVPTRGSTAP